jgi:hypothetical protein
MGAMLSANAVGVIFEVSMGTMPIIKAVVMYGTGAGAGAGAPGIHGM